MTDPTTDPSKTDEDVFKLPVQTAPTWEVELLISAASLFSLIMLPPLVDETTNIALAYLGEQLEMFVTFASMYTKVIVYALVLTFGLHLVLRATWVSTLGLRSVYPQGIRWDKLRIGALYRDYAERNNISLEATIERVDNAASVVFACGTMLAILSATIMLGSMLFALIDASIGKFFFNAPLPLWGSMGLLVALSSPIILASVIDRRYGKRLRPDGWLARGIQLLYRFWGGLGVGKIIAPMVFTISSQVGQRRFQWLQALIVYSLFAVIAVEHLVRSGRLDLGVTKALPAGASASELLPAHYATTRDRAQIFREVPYIPDPVVEGNYLRLVVPFQAGVMRAPLAEQCPQLRDPDADASETLKSTYAAELLDCVTAIYQPKINGRTTSARFDIATDPASGMRAFASFIDVRRLGNGRHLLSVQKPVDADAEEGVATQWQIPFYR